MRRITLIVLFMSFCSGVFALGQDDLDQVAARMSAAAGRSFDVRVESDSALNAYASLDGRLAVTSGMLGALKTRDELAFVLGHEMTHVLRGHGKRQVENLTLGAIGGLLLGVLLKADKEDLASIAGAGASLANGHPSRENEYEADARGLDLAVKAGYDSQGGPQAMRLLLDRYGRGDAGVPVIGWFSSHPDTQNRLKRLEEQAGKLEAAKPEAAEAGIHVASAADQPILAGAAMPEVTEPSMAPVTTPPPSEIQPASATYEVAPPVTVAPAIESKPAEPTCRFGDIISHEFEADEALTVGMAPKNTAKVAFKLYGDNGYLKMQGETVELNPATLQLDYARLRPMGGRLELVVIALDASGDELDRATITLVVR